MRVGILDDKPLQLFQGAQDLREVLYIEPNHREALFLLGFLYEHAAGVDANPDAARQHYTYLPLTTKLMWFRRSAELENPKAMVRLGHMAFHGLGLPAPSHKSAFEHYQRAAQYKNDEALTNLG